MRKNREIDANIHHHIIEERMKLSQIKQTLENTNNVIQIVSQGKCLLGFNALKELMEENYAMQFNNDPVRDQNFSLLSWLGFFRDEESGKSSADERKKAIMLDADGSEVVVESLIHPMNSLSINELNAYKDDQNAELDENIDVKSDDFIGIAIF